MMNDGKGNFYLCKIFYFDKKRMKMENSNAGNLTNLQRELLKVFSVGLDENQLIDIRALLTRYFAESATKEMDRLWDERGWTQETMKQWANEQQRTKKQ
jgi:hypothetical protein